MQKCYGVPSVYLIKCVEQENQESVGATQQGEVTRSRQVMQQQVKQVSDTITTLVQQLSELQQATS